MKKLPPYKRWLEYLLLIIPSKWTFSRSFNPIKRRLLVSQCEYIGVYYSFSYDASRALQHQLGYARKWDTLLNDWVVMRILEPSSKLRSISFRWKKWVRWETLKVFETLRVFLKNWTYFGHWSLGENLRFWVKFRSMIIVFFWPGSTLHFGWFASALN